MFGRRIMIKFVVMVVLMSIFLGCDSETTTTAPTGNAPSAGAVAAAVPGTRDSTPVVLSTVASGENVKSGKVSEIDISNVSKGYFMVKYTGSSGKVKMQVMKEGGTTYNYDLVTGGGYEVFPISLGDGTYTVTINENIKGTSYAMVDKATFSVTLESTLSPFLYPNKYVNFTSTSASVTTSQQVAMSANSDLDVIGLVYDYVTGGISYDYDLAASVTTFYIPNVDSTLSTKKGLCFDYAAAMTVMLRAQRIPTQLVLGYAGEAYHAWINVYTPETGWINGAIQFDGTTWTRMDPTFASTGGADNPSITQYVGDGKNYNAMFFY